MKQAHGKGEFIMFRRKAKRIETLEKQNEELMHKNGSLAFRNEILRTELNMSDVGCVVYQAVKTFPHEEVNNTKASKEFLDEYVKQQLSQNIAEFLEEKLIVKYSDVVGVQGVERKYYTQLEIKKNCLRDAI